MGIWIGIAITLFVIGSIMSLKPSPIDQRLDKLRMQARKLELNPKLLACPDWIRGKDNEFGKGMLAQYSLVDDDFQLPFSRYQIIDNQWRPIDIEGNDYTDFSLDKISVDFPDTIQPFIKGLSIRANCITLYWEDVCYTRPTTNKHFTTTDIEPHLIQLKSSLKNIVLLIQKN